MGRLLGDRLIDGISLGICVPTYGTNPSDFTFSLAQLGLHLGSVGLRTRPGELQSVTFDFQTSSDISTNQETLVTRALERGNTHVLFLEHDMYFPVEAVESIFSRRLPIVATNYLTREREPKFVAVSPKGHHIEESQSSTGVEEVLYTGFGVSLFEAPIFDEIPQPWFEVSHVAGTSKYTTSDVPFYLKARKAGFAPVIDHDASKMIEHSGSFRYQWRDYQRMTGEVKMETWSWKL